MVPLHTSVRGRARFRIAALHRDDEVKSAIEARLTRAQAITAVEASSVTASVLVHFDSARPAEDIIPLITRELQAVVESVVEIGNGSKATAVSLDPLACPPDNGIAGRVRDIAAAVHGTRHAPAGNGIAAPPAEGTTSSNALWHAMSPVEVARMLDTSSAAGLATTTAMDRLAGGGPNCLPEAEGRSALSMLADQVASVPVGLLAGSAALSLLTGGVLDASLIVGVIGTNALIGFFTERQAERTIRALGTVTPGSATVFRDGMRQEIPAQEIVTGDLVHLASGMHVPADLRLLDATRLTVDESALTGESMPVIKIPSALCSGDIPLADRVNMAYMGTLVTGGSGRGIVVATGAQTELGKIHALVGTARPPETPMQRQLDQMGTQLAVLSGGVCAGVFGLGVLRGYGTLEMALISTSLAVAAVPEGLPTVATTTLALGIHDMRQQRVFIRRLDAVESLGTIQVLCLDKTGTLTRNHMMVTALHTDGGEATASPAGIFIDGKPVDVASDTRVGQLLGITALCNESEIEWQDGKAVLNSSPTENALLQLALDAGVDVEELRRRHPLIDMTHRTEQARFMSTLHAGSRGNRILALKGSPQEVLAKCRWYAREGKRVALDDVRRAEFMKANERMAGDALRVLGIAYGTSHGTDDPDPDDLTWLGLVGMTDPIRAGMHDLIRRFHGAGIDTVMITGDQSATAYAVGRQLRIANGGPLEILDSESLDRLDPELLCGLAGQVHIFARVSPAHKLEIVQALQHSGTVVAMTGDGVNDGPALRAADIGIVVGECGTDLARSVADVVIDGDDLQQVLTAVRHGRTIHGNIRKSVHFLIATNLSEIELVFGAVALGAGSPLGTMQLLWINLITDVVPGIALSLEPPEADVMEHPPRDPGEPILGRSQLKRVGIESATMASGALASYAYGLQRYGMGAQASTCAFMTLTLSQLLHAVSCRSEEHSVFDGPAKPSNPYLNVGLGACFGLQMLAATFSPLRGLLGLAPIALLDAAVIGVGATLPFLVTELMKRTSSRSGQPRLPQTLALPEPEMPVDSGLALEATT